MEKLKIFRSKYRLRLFHNDTWIVLHFAHWGLKIQRRPLPDPNNIIFIDRRLP